jgi:hypothetical protein
LQILKSLASYRDFENAARLLYCALYGRKDFVANLDELRCNHFVTKKGGDLRTLTTTEDVFEHHMKRDLHPSMPV